MVIKSSPPICFCQMRLCYDAALPEQDQRYEAVGTAMDKELSVWRPLEEDTKLSHMSLFSGWQEVPLTGFPIKIRQLRFIWFLAWS